MQKKTKPAILLVLLVAFSLNLAGCTYFKIIARGNKPLLLNQPQGSYDVLAHFTKETSIMFDYTGAPDVTKALQEALSGYPDADGAVNIFISVKGTVGDFILNLFTIGIAKAYTLQVEGDIIRYKK